MKRDFFKLSVKELREWFNRETKLFIKALEGNVPWQELQKKKDMMRNISLLIEEKSQKENLTDRSRIQHTSDSH